MEQKYAIVKRRTQARIVKACRTTKERNMVIVLMGTGMHVAVYSDPDGHDAAMEGGVLHWRRPKTMALVQLSPRSKQLVREIDRWLDTDKWDRRDRRTYWRWCKAIGKRAGYPGLSPMSFRHTFGVNDIGEHGNIALTMHRMKCSLRVAERHYFQVQGGVV